ncbi:MAG: hypothetical protein NTW26_06850 [bacterium]|nr:hypothetical protein [bacterium]
MSKSLEEILKSVKTFEDKITEILSTHETSKRRSVQLSKTLKRLKLLTVKQKEFFDQSIQCIQHKYDLFKSAHVMAWAGFIDFLQEKLCSDGCMKIKSYNNKKYCNINNAQELRDELPSEYQQIVLAKSISYINEKERIAFLALLDKRNWCAHTGIYAYKANLSSSLSYVLELFDYLEDLDKRTL